MPLLKLLSMDYHSPKRAVNNLLLRYAGQGQRPVFFNIDHVCPELRELERAFPQIKKECEALLQGQVDMPRYHDVNRPAIEISSTTAGDWKVFMLELLGHRPKAREQCPATVAALAKVPRLLQAFFSVLDPGKSIPEHDGPYLGYLRYHLGLVVPQQDPPFIRIAGQPYTWKEGEGVLFDDSWPHEVVNKASERRVVLIVDVPRPLPLLPRVVNNIVLWGLAAPLYGKKVVEKADRYNGDLL